MTVAAEIAALADMSSTRLRERWGEVNGGVVPKVSPSLLRLALAWELQARAYGGLSREAVRVLDQRAEGNTRTSVARPGMRLVREWRGRVHVVTIERVAGNEVIRWDGREWRSLSEVARAITGTRWSGPAFFGLKRKVAA